METKLNDKGKEQDKKWKENDRKNEKDRKKLNKSKDVLLYVGSIDE